jgi:ureidoacrylate peracid hydrolase
MHKSEIPQDVLAQIRRSRGGRINRYDTFVGPKTALVVIDLQNVFMLPGMPVEVPAARGIVPNVNRLAAAVRKVAGKVVWVKMTLVGQRETWSVYFDADSRDAAVAEMTPGSKGYELHAELDVRDEDLIVEKNRYSAFIQGASDIDAKLRALGIDTVVIVGALTNVCCESSARDAMMLNYKVAFVSDANAAINDTEHNGTLTSIARVFGDVASADEVIARLVPGDAGIAHSAL